MASYKSVMQKDAKGEIIRDKQGNAVTKSFLVNADGDILCDTAFEDGPEIVALRAEVEGHKMILRHGDKLYKINDMGERKLEPRVAENNPGSIDIAEREFAEENKAKAEIEKEFKERQKQKIKTKP